MDEDEDLWSIPEEEDFKQRFADKPYDEVLALLADPMPRVAAALQRAHYNRTRKARKPYIQKRLRGLEDLLGFLDRSRDAMQEHEELRSVAFLVQRVIDDYEMGIEAMLSEMRSVVFDLMRDVMEVEYLLNDFTDHPDHLQEWLNQQPEKLLSKFRAAELRSRRAKVLGLEKDNLPTTADYTGHSRAVHVNPFTTILGQRGVLPPPSNTNDLILTDSSFWEMYYHGSAIIVAIRDLCKSRGLVQNNRIFADEEMEEFTGMGREVWIYQDSYFEVVGAMR